MAEYHNHHEYLSYIYDKYKKSNQYYKKVFKKDESSELFLILFEAMNVYPIYARPIIMPLKKKDDVEYDLKIQINQNLNINLEDINQWTKQINDKIKEFSTHGQKFKELHNKDKIRRFFSYEIIDTVNPLFPRSKITNAWVKMYELLSTYNFFNQKQSKTISTFHLCEHPGAFIYAVKDYIKNHGDQDHEFIFQSLEPGSNPKIFKPDPELIKRYEKNLDYGPKRGDVTNPENIRYYINKYKKNFYHLITSDCGLDYSEDFTIQESDMYKIFLGAFITAIGLSHQGSHYIFKLFSFNESKTIELLQLVCLFYEQVDVVRLLTDKSGSGEIYCVCYNFNYKYNIDPIIDTLIQYIDKKNSFVLDKLDDKFKSRIIIHHQLLTMRRITSYNQLIFRLFNNEYSQQHPEVKVYVKHLVNYYVNYFLTYIGLLSNA